MTEPADRQGGLDRRAVVAALLADRGDLLVVSGLGSTTWDVAAAGDHPRNFYLWGAMGGAAMIGLGLALARPKEPVVVITGPTASGKTRRWIVFTPETTVSWDNAKLPAPGEQ